MDAVESAQNIQDVRRLAQKRLPKGIFEFIDRGAEDEVALDEIRSAFRRLKFRPKVLTGVADRSTEAAVLGKNQAMPIAIAPTGAAGLVWYDGELELAKAATETGVPFILATRSMRSIEDIARLAGGTLWFQLYPWNERTLSYELVARAEAAGFEALVVTVDVPVSPNREYNQRNGFSLPFNPTPRALGDILLHQRWFLGVLVRYLMTTGMPRYENQPDKHRNRITSGASGAVLRGDSITWDDLRGIRKAWPRKLLVKGILRGDDALRAVECGADGVVVSSHGGRCLDSAVAPIDVLPEIIESVGRRAEVLLDSGIRRGSDVVKALALGASAVLVGRSTLFGTAVGGRRGAARVLRILQQEMLTTMGQLGCPTVSGLTADLLASNHPPSADQVYPDEKLKAV